MKARLSELAPHLGGRLVGDDAVFDAAAIDTRKLAPGVLFFALSGQHVDGHEFVGRAACLGAAGAVVRDVVDTRLPQIVVDDVERALQHAGVFARQAFEGDVVGVTGSNGKTTTKQMLAAVLAEAGTVLATEGNLNNHLGVPLTLLRLDDTVDRAVIEMGANHAGEIAMLAALVKPHVGLVTNAGMAHIEGFGSREGVAHAKGEMYQALGPSDTAVINADDDFAPLWHDMTRACRRIRFARQADDDVDVYADAIRGSADRNRFVMHTPRGAVDIDLPLAGVHNISNALAAAAASLALGLEPAAIARGLNRMQPVGGRMAVTAGRHGTRLIDDSYNANPGSLTAALGWLAQQSGPRWAALGDMGELGDQTDDAHLDAGVAARRAGVERLWLVGDKSRLTADAFGEGATWFPDHDALIEALDTALAAQDQPTVVLIKGSRSARMDRVVDALAIADANLAGSSC